MNEIDSMKTHKGLFGAVTVLLVLGAVLWYSGVIEGESRNYEVRPQVRPEIRPEIRVPEYRSDAARAIDAYERLMDRYMSLSEKNFGGIETDLRDVNRKLDSIAEELRVLSARMGSIEKALDIKPAIPEKISSVTPHVGGQAGPVPGGVKRPEVTRKAPARGGY